MQYFDFSKVVLQAFPDFRKYLLEIYEANEVDLLPSNLSFLLIKYLGENASKNGDIDKLISMMAEMKKSSDEDVVMLHNEMIDDIDNEEKLSGLLKSNNIQLLTINPYAQFSKEEVKARLLKKRIEVDYKGNKYIEENKKLLAEYKK